MLPIESALPDLLNALSTGTSAVLVAPPGAGKTTRVPLALLTAPWLADQKILMLEPRRLAARAAASRMAGTLGEPVGASVGYQIRRDRRIGPGTRIMVVTEGILTRMLQDDPALEGTGLVIFDEFHERSLIADTGLALTLASRELLRPDLRVLAMSATIDGAAVAALLDGAPVVRSEGRAFPVSTSHHPQPRGTPLETHVARVVLSAIEEESGSVLVFLPGTAEIRRVDALLSRMALPGNVRVYPLHGMLSGEAQDEAVAPPRPGQRKVVLATNIAETSLTIEGVRVVVDSGWKRAPRFSPRTGMSRLETMRISRASADQRAGRAGRTEPGQCRRCWSVAEESGLAPFDRPEMLDADLAPLALDLVAAGFPDPALLRWLDTPPPAAFAQAQELLRLLGALDEGNRLTPHGREMAALGTHPRFAHLLLRAQAIGNATALRATHLVALLEERDPIRGNQGAPPSDIRLRLDAIERGLDPVLLGDATVDHGGVARVREGAAEWQRRIGAGGGRRGDASEDVGLLLALTFPDRVAQRRGGAGRFVLRNGRGALLPPTDPLAHEEWLVIAQLDDTGRDARVLLAAPLALDELLRHAREQITQHDEVSWDDSSGSVTGRRRTMLGALTISEGSFLPGEEQVQALLIAGVRDAGVGLLPWSEGLVRWRERVTFLHSVDPRWPDLSDAALANALDEWLSPFLSGIRRASDVRHEVLANAMHLLVPATLRGLLDEYAPERLEVPSGSHIQVDYADPARPTLSVRLQEVFGWHETPRLGGGKVPVTMELLSPGYRPVQITRDLASFWKSGYFDVRKDLRGRYPKHSWPEDPVTAVAVRGARRKT